MFPDVPLHEVPENIVPFAALLFAAGKVANVFRIRVLSEKAFYLIAGVILYLLFYAVHKTLELHLLFNRTKNSSIYV